MICCFILKKKRLWMNTTWCDTKRVWTADVVIAVRFQNVQKHFTTFLYAKSSVREKNIHLIYGVHGRTPECLGCKTAKTFCEFGLFLRQFKRDGVRSALQALRFSDIKHRFHTTDVLTLCRCRHSIQRCRSSGSFALRYHRQSLTLTSNLHSSNSWGCNVKIFINVNQRAGYRY